jgi:hypothetical protein
MNKLPAVAAALSHGLGGETDAIDLSTTTHRDGPLTSYSGPKRGNDVETRPRNIQILNISRQAPAQMRKRDVNNSMDVRVNHSADLEGAQPHQSIGTEPYKDLRIKWQYRYMYSPPSVARKHHDSRAKRVGSIPRSRGLPQPG